jgi:hypothetical protein
MRRGGAHRVGKKLFVLCFANIHPICAALSLGEKRKRKHDHALTADKRQQVPPHIDAVADMV